MNINRVLRPALRTLTAGLVTAVAVTTLAAPSATIAGKEGLKNSKPTVSAGKEGLKKRQADVTVAGKEGLKKRQADVTVAGKEGLKKRQADVILAGKEGLKKRQADVILAGKEGLKKRIAAPGTTASSVGIALVAASASPAYSSDSYESQVQAKINSVRNRHGLRSLTLQSCTDRMAEGWSSHLASSGDFYHRSMGTVLRGCDARYAGETLGRGQISPGTLVSMWMNSPPHRRVLLSGQARRIGVGATPNSSGQWVVAANFTRF